MEFYEKIIQLRKEKGWSQEQLADVMEVSRQSVSKWESGVNMPEIDKIIILADLFEVSVDFLVRKEQKTYQKNVHQEKENAIDNAYLQQQLGDIQRYIKTTAGHYEYISKIHIWGIPLVHVHFSRQGANTVAKGIFAFGNVAIGLFAVGGIAIGGISLGGLALGLLLAFGGVSLGTIACGGVAIGVMAFGGAAIGHIAIGGAALGLKLGVGGAAVGEIAVGAYSAQGQHALVVQTPAVKEIKEFILRYYPDIPTWILNIASTL